MGHSGDGSTDVVEPQHLLLGDHVLSSVRASQSPLHGELEGSSNYGVRMHDLVIRGGFLVDGTGRPGRLADIAVDDGVITAVVDAGASPATTSVRRLASSTPPAGS